MQHSDLKGHLKQAVLESSKDPVNSSSNQDTVNNISIHSDVTISKKTIITRKSSIKITDPDYKELIDKIVPIAD